MEERLTAFERYFENKEFVWKPGLERIEKAVEEFGGKGYPSIIVAGTNGKGSVSHLISEALVKNGLKVGLFTSPHLFRFNERIKVNRKEVETEELDEAFNSVLPLIERFELTYFEASLLLALEVFKKERVDAAVFEVGLGGRLDATNVLNHQVAVLTSVSLDHTNYLGSSLSQIAKEKAEVFRGVPFGVVGDVERSIVETVKSVFDGELHLYGRDFWADGISVSVSGTSFYYMGSVPLKTTLIGEHQAVNTSVAVRASQLLLEQFFGEHFLIPTEFTVKLPGRFEVLRENPPVIFDVAHNEGALKKLFETVKELGISGDVYYSGLKDKEQERNLKVVSEYLKWSCGTLYLLQIENERAESVEKLKEMAVKLGVKNVKIIGRVKVKELKKPSVITGSFYIGGLVERG